MTHPACGRRRFEVARRDASHRCATNPSLGAGGTGSRAGGGSGVGTSGAGASGGGSSGRGIGCAGTSRCGGAGSGESGGSGDAGTGIGDARPPSTMHCNASGLLIIDGQAPAFADAMPPSLTPSSLRRPGGLRALHRRMTRGHFLARKAAISIRIHLREFRLRAGRVFGFRQHAVAIGVHARDLLRR